MTKKQAPISKDNIVCHYCDYSHGCIITDVLECKIYRENAGSDGVVAKIQNLERMKGITSAIKRNRQSIKRNRGKILKLELEIAKIMLFE